MEIVTNTINTLQMNAKMVAIKIRDLIQSEEVNGEVKFSLDLTKPSLVQIFIRRFPGREDAAADLRYVHFPWSNDIAQQTIEHIYKKTGIQVQNEVVTWLRDVVEPAIKLEGRKDAFEEACYSAYQLDWMISHGHSLSNLYKVWLEYEQESFDPDDFNEKPFDESDLERAMMQARDVLLYERGFGESQIFASKNEFLTHEFQDSDYMEHLLTLMPNTASNRVFYYCTYKAGEVIS